MKRGLLTPCLLPAIFSIGSSVAQAECYRVHAAPVATYPAAPAVVTARPVVVDTDVYVPGQPVRNVPRAITP